MTEGERRKGRDGEREKKRIINKADKVLHPSSRLVTLRQVVTYFVPGPEQTK